MRTRYLRSQLWLPRLRRRPSGRWRLGRQTIHLPMDDPRRPFGTDYACYYGDHWFTGSRRAAAILLRSDECDAKLRRHLARRASADECYYHTVLGNEPGLSLRRDTRRFVDWGGGGAHPRALSSSDLERMLGSGCHFARKFAPDDPVLDAIDAALVT